MNKGKITKSQIKYLQSLKLKKYRQKYNKFIVEGTKMVKELQETKPQLIELVTASPSWLESNMKNELNYYSASTKDLQQISQHKTSPEVIALVFQDEEFQLKENHISGGRYIYVHELNDPGNGGTIFRLADWFGFDGIILSSNSVDVFNHKFIQSSMGSIWRIPFIYLDFDELKQSFDLPVISSSLDGELLSEFTFPDSFILLLGNESKGLPLDLIEQSDHSLLISDQWSKGAESLNIAVSAGILLYEARKK